MTSNSKEQETKLTRTDTLYLLLLFLLISLVYLPQLFLGQTAMDSPENMCITSLWFPIASFLDQSFHEGYFPLWNPHRYAGMPWLAYSHSAGLYPVNTFFFTIFNFADGATLSHLFHCLLAALSLYILFRKLRFSTTASFMASLVFSLSGFYFYMQSHFINRATISWTPLLLCGLVLIHRRPRASWVILVGLVSAMMVLGGDIEGFIYNLFVAFPFIVFYLRREEPEKIRRTIFLAGCAIGVGLLISAAQIFVTQELMVHSIRSSGAFLEIDFFSGVKGWFQHMTFLFFPWQSFKDIHPSLDYNKGLNPLYIGVLPLMGVIYSLRLYLRDSRARAFWYVASIMLVYLVAKESDFASPFIKQIPVLGKLHTHTRILEQIQLVLLFAAAGAFDYFIKNHTKRSYGVFSLILASWGLATLILAPKLLSTETRYLLGALMILFGIISFFTKGEKKYRARLAAWFVSILVISDVYLLSLAAVPRTPKDLFELDPTVDNFIEKQDLNYRFMSFQKIGAQIKQGDLSGLISGHKRIGSPCGDNRLLPHRYYEFLYLINPNVAIDWRKHFRGTPSGRRYFFTADLFNPHYLSERNLHLLNMMAVKYIFSRGISFEFASSYSLMHRKSLLRGHWLTFPVERNPDGSRAKADYFHNDNGRRALNVPLPYKVEFTARTIPGDELAFEVKPASDASGQWRVHVKISAARARDNRLMPLFNKGFEASMSSGYEFPVKVPLGRLAGGAVKFRIEISGDVPETNAVIVDARLIRKDAPFQRVEAGPVDIYINEGALTRAFLVHEARSMNLEEMREFMPDPDRFDPGRMILLEEGTLPGDTVTLTDGQTLSVHVKESLEIIHHGSEDVNLQAELSSPGWLFLSDVYYPGWKVWVDDRESRIYRANYAFRAVHLDEGKHSIRFQYQPASFRVGLWFSLTSLSMAFAIGVALAIKKIK